MRVLRSAEMQEADRRAIEDYAIPVLVLMENAALAVVSAIEQRIDELTGLATIVVAGPGNNGGDGLAVARLLWNRGAHVEVILLGGPEQLRSDATRTQFEIVRRLGLPVHAVDAATLSRQETRTQSKPSRAARGTGSVAEAAALAAAGPGARLLAPRVVSQDGLATCALAKRDET